MFTSAVFISYSVSYSPARDTYPVHQSRRPQLPWCTLPELLRNRRLEIAGWPEDLPLPDATGSITRKESWGLPQRMLGACTKPSRYFVSPNGQGARATATEGGGKRGRYRKPAAEEGKRKRKAPAEGEWKFRLSEVQSVIMRVGESN
ncbi:hypothetical protein BDZ89DRAFT_267334 [Hymenopellis radicata]|nr:hypothetical protein BDZ89DRAFT_267334 [Hymenopellis radicata]